MKPQQEGHPMEPKPWEAKGSRGGAPGGKEQPGSLMDKFSGRTEIAQLQLSCSGIPAVIPCFAPAPSPGHLQLGFDALKPHLRDGLAESDSISFPTPPWRDSN